MAFTAALSDGKTFYQIVVLYSRVFYGVLELNEDCGLYFGGTVICGGSGGFWICKVFVSWEKCVIYGICDFDVNAV